jgi:4-amino-4-deoxychorismate lyase
MNIPMDDHMVHRGHGVFDTAIVNNGCMYMLDQHLQRFVKSADAARITLPCDPVRLRDIVLDTAAASGCPDGGFRFVYASATPCPCTAVLHDCHVTLVKWATS